MITNVAAGDSRHTDVCISSGALPLLLEMLDSSPSLDVIEQSIWALGNVAGDSVRHRDQLLSLGVLPRILAAHERYPHRLSLVRNSVWALSNLCRGRPSPAFEDVCCVPRVHGTRTDVE